MYKAGLYDLAKQMDKKDGVYYAKRGMDSPKKQRLFLISGTHGNEFAGPLALKALLEMPWRWSNVSMTAVMQDPQGYQEEGYGFVDMQGKSSMWPPLWGYHKNEEGYWFYLDENSAWGNISVVPDRHKRMRKLMHDIEPTFCLSLHETVRSEVWRDPWWAGAGLLLIETWPVSIAELAVVTDLMGNPLKNLLPWVGKTLFNWLHPILGIQKWMWRAMRIGHNPYYELMARIADRYEAQGFELTHNRWLRYMENDLTIGPGRLLHNATYIISEWRTATDYAVGHFGCPSVTTESFQSPEIGLRGVDDRVAQQLAYITAVLDDLNENNQILPSTRDIMDFRRRFVARLIKRGISRGRNAREGLRRAGRNLSRGIGSPTGLAGGSEKSDS